jgi:hypothetical protein
MIQARPGALGGERGASPPQHSAAALGVVRLRASPTPDANGLWPSDFDLGREKSSPVARCILVAVSASTFILPTHSLMRKDSGAATGYQESYS